MRTVACGLIFLGLSLCVQSPVLATDNLNATLIQLQESNVDQLHITERLVNEMSAVARGDRRPSRSAIQVFSEQLVRAINGKKLTGPQLAQIRESITDVLTGSKPNFASASTLREALTGLRLNTSTAQSITKSFIVIGEEVRGPDDSPLLSDK